MVIIFQLFFIQYTYAFNLFSSGRLKNSFFIRPNFLISNIDISEAQNYSQVRSEDLKSQTKVITGSGTALTIAPGYTFTLTGITHHGNVGKGHKRPILREREAIEDLEKALAGQPDTHEKVTFWSYTNSKCQPKLCD